MTAVGSEYKDFAKKWGTFELPADDMIRIQIDASLGRKSDMPTDEHKRFRKCADDWVVLCKKNGWQMDLPNEVE